MLCDLYQMRDLLEQAREIADALRDPELDWAEASISDALSEVRGLIKSRLPERPILDPERVTLTSRELVG